jgi:hypothetical protein
MGREVQPGSRRYRTCSKMVLSIVLAAFLLSVSLAFSLGLTIPLIGTLVRFRANYSPKSVHLDQDGGLEPHVGPVVTSYWAMLKRVKRIEVVNVFKPVASLGLTPFAGRARLLQRAQCARMNFSTRSR